SECQTESEEEMDYEDMVAELAPNAEPVVSPRTLMEREKERERQRELRSLPRDYRAVDDSALNNPLAPVTSKLDSLLPPEDSPQTQAMSLLHRERERERKEGLAGSRSRGAFGSRSPSGMSLARSSMSMLRTPTAGDATDDEEGYQEGEEGDSTPRPPTCISGEDGSLSAQELLRNQIAFLFTRIQQSLPMSELKDHIFELMPYVVASAICRAFKLWFPAFVSVFSGEFNHCVYENIVYAISGMTMYPDVLARRRRLYWARGETHVMEGLVGETIPVVTGNNVSQDMYSKGYIFQQFVLFPEEGDFRESLRGESRRVQQTKGKPTDMASLQRGLTTLSSLKKGSQGDEGEGEGGESGKDGDKQVVSLANTQLAKEEDPGALAHLRLVNLTPVAAPQLKGGERLNKQQQEVAKFETTQTRDEDVLHTILQGIGAELAQQGALSRQTRDASMQSGSQHLLEERRHKAGAVRHGLGLTSLSATTVGGHYQTQEALSLHSTTPLSRHFAKITHSRALVQTRVQPTSVTTNLGRSATVKNTTRRMKGDSTPGGNTDPQTKGARLVRVPRTRADCWEFNDLSRRDKALLKRELGEAFWGPQVSAAAKAAQVEVHNLQAPVRTSTLRPDRPYEAKKKDILTHHHAMQRVHQQNMHELERQRKASSDQGIRLIVASALVEKHNTGVQVTSVLENNSTLASSQRAGAPQVRTLIHARRERLTRRLKRLESKTESEARSAAVLSGEREVERISFIDMLASVDKEVSETDAAETARTISEGMGSGRGDGATDAKTALISTLRDRERDREGVSARESARSNGTQSALAIPSLSALSEAVSPKRLDFVPAAQSKLRERELARQREREAAEAAEQEMDVDDLDMFDGVPSYTESARIAAEERERERMGLKTPTLKRELSFVHPSSYTRVSQSLVESKLSSVDARLRRTSGLALANSSLQKSAFRSASVLGGRGASRGGMRSRGAMSPSPLNVTDRLSGETDIDAIQRRSKGVLPPIGGGFDDVLARY
ncbi:FAM227 protein, partial [Kipferlia bialata]